MGGEDSDIYEIPFPCGRLDIYEHYKGGVFDVVRFQAVLSQVIFLRDGDHLIIYPDLLSAWYTFRYPLAEATNKISIMNFYPTSLIECFKITDPTTAVGYYVPGVSVAAMGERYRRELDNVVGRFGSYYSIGSSSPSVKNSLQAANKEVSKDIETVNQSLIGGGSSGRSTSYPPQLDPTEQAYVDYFRNYFGQAQWVLDTRDHDGTISKQELIDCLVNSGYSQYLASQSTEKIFAVLDKNNDQRLSTTDIYG